MNNSSEKKRKRVLPSSSSSRTKEGDAGTPPKATRKEARRQQRTSKKKRNKDSTTTTTTFHGGLSLTQNTVRSLARGDCVIDEDASSPVIVRIRLEERALIADNSNDRNNDDEGEGKSAISATMTDGFNHYKVLILNKSNELETCYSRIEKDLVVAIEGYVTSEGSNSKYHLCPIISITNYTILETRDKNDGFSFGDKVIFPRTQQPARFHTGTIGSFLDQRGPFLTTDELAGSALLSETFFQDAPLTASGDDTKIQPSPSHSSHMENLDTVGKFLARHIAMVTLQSSSQPPSSSTSRSSQDNVDDSNSPSETPSKKPLTDHAVQNYNAALREFTTSQMDRQKASLESNAGRETADRAILVRERHDSALNMALNLLDDSKQQRSLTPSLLQQLHKELLRDLHPEAGQFRTKMVRAGRTKFAPPDRIETEVTLLCNSLNSLEQRLDPSNPTHAVLFASMAMYGVVDIHPFLDGNGRLSRIIANWALKKVPFPINLFVTPAQRSEYVLALEKTRHFLSLTRTHGTVSRDEVLESIKTTGVFSSLIRLLMDRIARSVTECNRVFEEKSYLAAEAAEDRAARRARERSAQGTCIICFDEKPNIATLCCGKAVHLNCIAEWLSGNHSCPVCRSDIPSIHGRFNRSTSVRQRDTETSDDDDSSSSLPPQDSSSDDDDDEEEGTELENDTSNLRNLQGSDDVQITVSGRSFREALRDERLDTLDRVVQAMLGSYNTTTVDRNEEDDDDYDSEEIEDHTTTLSEDESEEHQERDQRNEDTTSTTASDDDDDDESHRYTRAAMFAESSGDDDEENGDFPSPEDHDHETALEDETEQEEEERAPAEETTTTVNDETNPEDTATDETTTQEEAALQPPPFEPRPAVLVCDALYCRNRRAADCVNTLCGRCCVLAGLRHCPRHNS